MRYDEGSQNLIVFGDTQRSRIFGHDIIYRKLRRLCALCASFDGTLVSNLPILIADVMLSPHKFFFLIPHIATLMHET